VSEPAKFCKDCRFSRFNLWWLALACAHPSALRDKSLVDGRPRSTCESERGPWVGRCGPKGEFFEPMHAPPKVHSPNE
jgi:hypothetical protein